MREVALHAGVSVKTVSRVFNDESPVTEKTRVRVQQSLRNLGYVANPLAQTFRTGRDAAVGVAVPDIADPFFAAVTRAIEDIAAARGVAVVVASSGGDPDRERSTVNFLLRRQLTGLIATPISVDQSHLDAWRDRTAIVFIDRAPADSEVDSFVDDDFGGAVTATDHLIGHGHRRVVFVGDDPTIPTTGLRLAGYRAALHKAGITADPRWVVLGDGSEECIREALGRLLIAGEPATAVFSSNARCSMAVIPVLRSIGRTDAALVSFGDLPLAALLNPPLTVIDQDPTRLGHLAAERVFTRLDTPARRVRRQTILPVRLIERGSGEQRPGP